MFLEAAWLNLKELVAVIAEIGYVVAGLLMIMIPGFLFSAALFPEAGGMDFWKRTGVSLGLGMLLLVYQVAVLARLKSMTTGPFITSVIIVTLGLTVAVYLRKGTAVVQAYVRSVVDLARKIPSFPLFKKLPKIKRAPPKVEELVEVAPPSLECPACKHSNPPDVIFCIHCGRRLKEEEPERKPPEKPEGEASPVKAGERAPDVPVQAGDSGKG
jgi:hypothetical protein